MIDITNLSKYEENNRIEAKRAKGGLPNSLWESYSAFANPGDIRIGLQTALAGGVSDPRNETVMKMFSLIDVGERAGSGIPDFISTWQKHFDNSPVYRNRNII